MPRRPARPCTHPGCGQLVRGGSRCPKHRTNRQAEKDRGSRIERGYDKRWQKLRLLILNRDPLCQICGKAPATEVDHIVAMAKGGSRDDEDNLRGVCRPCHSRKGVREDGGFGHVRKTVNSE